MAYITEHVFPNKNLTRRGRGSEFTGQGLFLLGMRASARAYPRTPNPYLCLWYFTDN